MVLEKLGRSLVSTIRKIRRLPLVDKNAINALIQDLGSIKANLRF